MSSRLRKQSGKYKSKKSLIKCGICDFTVMRWYYNKKGKLVNGKVILDRHIVDKHPDEHKAVQDKLKAITYTDGVDIMELP